MLQQSPTASQKLNPSKKVVKKFNVGINKLKKPSIPSRGYEPPEKATAPVRCYADGSFAAIDDLLFQVGFIILLRYGGREWNILEFQSQKQWRAV